MSYRKKLIEVALPLDEINEASAREKSIRHGHPSTLHLWWARRPLATCRAVLFASIIDDPDQPDVPQELLDRIDRLPIPYKYRADWDHLTEAEQRRKKLFGFIERLVQWENSTDEDILTTAHELILAATEGNPPPVLDPFCGGGSIPLEAQRLGLEAHGSDLNPVAVLITKALIEIPPRFANMPPINPDAQKGFGHSGSWRGATGLADDVRYYGKWMRDEAEKRIGHLYPKAQLPDGGEATVIAWIWARTVKCPNPACGCRMPLVRSFALSTKAGKQAWVEPVIDFDKKMITFKVNTDAGKPRDATVGKRGAVCICCNTPVPLDLVRAEGKAKRMGAQMMAIVAEGAKGRIYLSPTREQEIIAKQAVPDWMPDTTLPEQALGFRVQGYGMTTHADLFTKRQLVALSTFSALIAEARNEFQKDESQSSPELYESLTHDYSNSLATYLACSVSKGANIWSSLTSWMSDRGALRETFARQALPMVWDYAETNPFSDSGGNISLFIERIADAIEAAPISGHGTISQREALDSAGDATNFLFSTDPPYYDNVPYADLSDFFYVWLRRSLIYIYPQLFSTVLVPKAQELVADPFRHGGKDAAHRFFEEGMTAVFRNVCCSSNKNYPVTIYYAFKQSEAEDEEDSEHKNGKQAISSTGWETFLQGLINAGFQITGTWPVRTEGSGRIRNLSSNALASSIVLVCRPRPTSAQTATRRDFLSCLRSELPQALRHLQQGNIAPVDFAQAAIGPGMAVFSRYRAVLEADGKAMRVRSALQLINSMLDEVVDPIDADSETRWAVDWYRQFRFHEGEYGVAEVLATAKSVAIGALAESGIVLARGGKVKLLSRDEMKADYDPALDEHSTVWKVTQYLARALESHGTDAAAKLLRRFRDTRPEIDPERARELCFTLYTICERKGWAQEARPYNALVISWSDIEIRSQEPGMENYSSPFIVQTDGEVRDGLFK